MPEAFIIKRWDAEMQGFTDKWRKDTETSSNERAFTDKIIDTNVFEALMWQGQSKAIQKVLDIYLIDRDSIPVADEAIKNQRITEFEKTCSTTRLRTSAANF